jgi:hypothetical protein
LCLFFGVASCARVGIEMDVQDFLSGHDERGTGVARSQQATYNERYGEEKEKGSAKERILISRSFSCKVVLMSGVHQLTLRRLFDRAAPGLSTCDGFFDDWNETAS